MLRNTFRMGRSVNWHDEQPEEEMHRASSRSVLNVGASVPRSWSVSPSWYLNVFTNMETP